MTLITETYKNLQSQFHEERPDYGVSSRKHIDPIAAMAKQLGTRDILDYGCGKAMLQKGLPFPIQNYDPAMPEYTRRPQPADLVVCTDVLEHIEPECLKEVMDDLQHLTKKVLFVDVSCSLAKKILPDGRNAHLLVQTPNWWLSYLLARFDLQSFQDNGGSFIAILRAHTKHPHQPPPPTSASTEPVPSPLPGSASA